MHSQSVVSDTLDWAPVAHAWRAAALEGPRPEPEARFVALAATDAGAEFLGALADEVLRFDTDAGVARAVGRISARLESGELDVRVPLRDRVALALGAGLAPLWPVGAARLGRGVARRHLGHLTVERGSLEGVWERFEQLGGIRPVAAPSLLRALGDRQADLQLAAVEELVADSSARAVAFSLAAVVRLGTGGLGSAVREAVIDTATARLASLARVARATDTELVFEVERHRDLSLTAATVLRLLDQPDNRPLRVSLSLPVNYDSSLTVARQLVAWGEERSDRGGAPLTVRLCHADELHEERADAEAHRWAVRAHTDPSVVFACVRRLLDELLVPEYLEGLRVTIASEHPHDHAYAWRLARRRGVLRRVEHELRHAVTTPLGEVMKRVVGGIRLRVPVVTEAGEHRAADYLVRRVREVRADEVTVHEATPIPDLTVPPMGQRRVTDADPFSAEGRDFFDAVAESVRQPLTPGATVPPVTEASRLEERLTLTVAAAAEWSQRRGTTRATVLRAVAESLAHARLALVAAALTESGLTAAEADAEVTGAISLALSAAGSAEALDLVETARFEPVPLTLALAPRTSPIVGPASQLLGALAAGSAVVVKPAPETARSVTALVAAVLDAGVPTDLITVIEPTEHGLVRLVLGDARVGRVVHAGSRHIAKGLRHDFADARLLSTTSGRNSIIVSESADVERAVANVVSSAFRGAGQAPLSVGTVILVGEHERFVSLLTDAVASLRPGSPLDLTTEVGALARPASGAMLECLTTLRGQERWLVAPRRLDDQGRLWSPGLVDEVEPGSLRHVTERRAPLLSLVRVESFDEAIALQNGQGFGLVAGLQSSDPDEVALWLDAAEAGGLVVNAPTTDAIAVRVPVAGWRRSNVGVSRAAAGQLQLDQFGAWMPVDPAPDESVTLEGMSEQVAALITAAQPALSFDEFDWVRSAARDDERVWRAEFSLEREVLSTSGDVVVSRYRALPVTVRVTPGGSFRDLVRVIAAATRVHAPVAVSSALPLPEVLIRFFRSSDSPVAEVVVEAESRWLARVHAGDVVTERVRLIGDDSGALRRVLARHAGASAVTSPVTASGRAELAAFVAEQSVRIPH